MIKSEHLQRAVDVLLQRFVEVRRHKAFFTCRKFPMSRVIFHRLIASEIYAYSVRRWTELRSYD
eukprot:6195861-Pleurochrysis_carterae.AAC.1